MHAIPDDLPFGQAALAGPSACVIDGRERVGVSAGEVPSGWRACPAPAP